MSRRPDRVEDPHLPAQGATDHTDRGHNGASVPADLNGMTSVRAVRNAGESSVGCVRKDFHLFPIDLTHIRAFGKRLVEKAKTHI